MPILQTKSLRTKKISSETNKVLENEICSISALARKFNLDRDTVRNRLINANIQPIKDSTNEKLYELTPQVRRLLEKDEKEAAQTQKLHTEVQLLEQKLAKERGEHFSKKEVKEIFLTVFGKMQKKVCLDFPSKHSKKIHDANSATDVANYQRKVLSAIFQELRDESDKFFPIDTK